jgi:uncharacterized Zn finger protein
MTSAIDTARVDQITAAIARAATGASLARAAGLVKDGKTFRTDLPGTYLVAASDGIRHYVTTTSSCTCPGHAYRGHCKHVLAVLIRTLTTP